ncbi:MAG: hypothetical protein RL166_249 [Actinomycetota bacterium]|jgi:hypothetical protein
MYSLLYSKLRGGKLAKVLQLLILAGAVIAILFLWVFPMIEVAIPEDPSLNG